MTELARLRRETADLAEKWSNAIQDMEEALQVVYPVEAIAERARALGRHELMWSMGYIPSQDLAETAALGPYDWQADVIKAYEAVLPKIKVAVEAKQLELEVGSGDASPLPLTPLAPLSTQIQTAKLKYEAAVDSDKLDAIKRYVALYARSAY